MSNKKTNKDLITKTFEAEVIAEDGIKSIPLVESHEPHQAVEVEEPKPMNKADRARVIYNEMVIIPENGREEIASRIRQEMGVSKAAAYTYFYQFQRETGRVREKQVTKVDKARPVYERLVSEGKTRQQIIDGLIEEASLTPAGASTYYQNFKRERLKASKAK